MTIARIPENDLFLTDDSKALISCAVHQMMMELRSGRMLTDVIADKLCSGVATDGSSALPDYLAGGIDTSRNNAYFLAEYIINRVTDHDETLDDFMDDPDAAIRRQLEDLISGCTQSQAIRRMHTMLSCLRIAKVQLTARYADPLAAPQASARELPPYEGLYNEAALESLMQDAARELASLTLTQDALERYTQAIKAHGDAFITSELYTRHCIEIKSLTATVIYILARKNMLPEVACDVKLDGVITSVCLWADMQVIAGTVEAGQQVFDTTKELIKLALMAAVVTLFVTLLKSGTIKWLLELLLCTPLTLIIGLITAFTLGPVIVGAVSEAENMLAAAAAQFTAEHGQTPVRYALSTARERMIAAFTSLTAAFKPAEAPDHTCETTEVFSVNSVNADA